MTRQNWTGLNGVRHLNHRCQALDQNGKRCRKKAIWTFNVHLEPEIYSTPAWVLIEICQEHAVHYGMKKVDGI